MKIREIIEPRSTSILPNENSLGKPIAHSEEALQNFWNWFNGSKIVDSQGRPLVVYHGTIADFSIFDIEKAGKGARFGAGHYFSGSKNTMDSYGQKENGIMMPVYLRLRNPMPEHLTAQQINKFMDALEVTKFTNGYDASEDHVRIREEALAAPSRARGILLSSFSYIVNKDWQRGVIAAGFDGIIETVFRELEYVVLSSSQIKSAIGNQGKYGQDEPNIIDEDEDGEYRGSHTAPDREQGSPLYDLCANGTFPADLYSAQGLKYYGNGSSEDVESYRIAMVYHHKPDAIVTIYRAVPDALKGLQKKITTLEKQKAMYMSRGKIPRDAGLLSGTQWYEWASDELDRLHGLPRQAQATYVINAGDWVAVSKRYAIVHGQAHLNNEYSIISKKVRAKDIFCVGDLSEWGYDPV
jgi:hypothetical protein